MPAQTVLGIGDLGSFHDLAAPVPVPVRLDIALVVEGRYGSQELTWPRS